jgi:hypothetical protein
VTEAPCQNGKGRPMAGLDSVRPNGEATRDCGPVKLYTAWLTGDVWKKISHRYTVQEAEDLIPATTIAEIKIAVRSIYLELKWPVLVVAISKTETHPESKVRVEFQDSSNPRNNVSKYELLTDGLPTCRYWKQLMLRVSSS